MATLSVWGVCVGMHVSQDRFEVDGTPIADIRLGDNVPGVNPSEPEDPGLGTIEPASWRAITLQTHQADGGAVELEMLRRESWLAEGRRAYGITVQVEINEHRFSG